MRNIALVALGALLAPFCVHAQDSENEAKAIVDQTRALKTANAARATADDAPTFDTLPVVTLHTTSPNYVTDVAGAKEIAEKVLTDECLAESQDGALVGPTIEFADGRNAHAFRLCRRADMNGPYLYELLSAKDSYLFRIETAKANAQAALAEKCKEMGPEARLVGKAFNVLDGFAANAVQACRFKKPG